MRVLCVLFVLLARIAPTEQYKRSDFSLPGDLPRALETNPDRDVTMSSVVGFQSPQQGDTRKKLASIDPVSRATNGWLDYFVLTYWGCMLSACAVAVSWTFYHPESRIIFAEKTSDVDDDSMVRRKSSWNSQGMRVRTLDADFWSLCLLSAYGRVHDGNGRKARPSLLYLIACCLGMLQLCALALVLIGINPNASPWTTTPSASWSESAKSVNCMKFIMVLFQSLSLTTEACGAYKNFLSAVYFNAEETGSRPTILTAIIPCFHYFVTLGTVVGGVSVVLSCQQVPSVLYNSLAILFITQMDEVMFRFCKEMCGLEVDWEIPVSESEAPGWKSRVLRQILVAFPMIFGFGLLGRAWYTNTMPVTTVVIMQIVNSILRW